MLVLAPCVFILGAVALVEPAVAAPVPTSFYASEHRTDYRDVDSAGGHSSEVHALDRRLALPSRFGDKIIATALAAIVSGFTYAAFSDPLKSFFAGLRSDDDDKPAQPQTGRKRSLFTPERAGVSPNHDGRSIWSGLIRVGSQIGFKGGLKEFTLMTGLGAAAVGIFTSLGHALGGSDDPAPVAERRSLISKDVDEPVIQRRNWLTAPLIGGKSPAAMMVIAALGSVATLVGGLGISTALEGTRFGKYFSKDYVKRDLSASLDQSPRIEKRVTKGGVLFGLGSVGVGIGGAVFGDWLFRKGRDAWRGLFGPSEPADPTKTEGAEPQVVRPAALPDYRELD